MMTKQSILLLVFTLFIFVRCTKDESCTHEKESKRITLNITRLFLDTLGALAELNPASFRVKIYSSKDALPLDYHLTEKCVTLDLPENSYRILLYTSDFYDVDATFYRSLNNLEEVEAYTRTEVVNGQLYMEEPDPVFSNYADITSDQSFQNIDLILYPRVFVYRFRIKAEGLAVIRKASATISGLYPSICLKDGNHLREDEASMKIDLQLRGDSLQGEFRSFGSHPKAKVMHMSIRFTTLSGAVKVVEMDDLTAKMKALPHGGILKIDQQIVITSEGDDGGFKPGMDDWDDEDVTLPIW